ncbi:MAG: PIN domain-containing protein [Limisphaerales bacterium]
MKLIDTSIWVEFLRRKGEPRVKNAVARLLQTDQAAHTCPIRFELLSGAKADEENDLEQALNLSQHYPFEPDDWRQAALLERILRAKGLTIPRNDIFVAVVAIRARIPIVCRDKHFDIIGEIAAEALAAKKFSGELKVEQL